MPKAIGFTGSRTPPTGNQLAWLRTELVILRNAGILERYTEFHHGDCVGSDAAAHQIARELGYRIVVHPPDNPRLRAYCNGDEIRAEKPYLVRNHDIVDESELLLALPAYPEIKRSGTWLTIRYARSVGVPVLLQSQSTRLHRS